MSPRKSHEGRVPRWLYKGRAARVKGVIHGPYDCPSCGSKGLTINVNKDNETVSAKCLCGFSEELVFRHVFQPVDYYGKLIDEYYKKIKSKTAGSSNS